MIDMEQKAAQMDRMSDAIMSAISATGDEDAIDVVVSSLGTVVGCWAAASGSPDEFLKVIMLMAQGVLSDIGCGEAIN